MLNGNKSISRFLATQIDRPSPVSVRNASSTDRGKHWNHLEYPKLECLGGVFFFLESFHLQAEWIRKVIRIIAILANER